MNKFKTRRERERKREREIGCSHYRVPCTVCISQSFQIVYSVFVSFSMFSLYIKINCFIYYYFFFLFFSSIFRRSLSNYSCIFVCVSVCWRKNAIVIRIIQYNWNSIERSLNSFPMENPNIFHFLQILRNLTVCTHCCFSVYCQLWIILNVDNVV